MPDRLYLYAGTDTDPLRNLAFEAALLESFPEGACVLYLWRNRKTVVVGRNQNLWAECRPALLEREGGMAVRRLSGGGAVYHDLGNLNFTFLAHRPDYDVSRQTEIVARALAALGIDTRKNGRNDLTSADGRKFSGHAYYKHSGRCLHHGTLMVDVDGEAMARYLTVPPDKLAGKGVASVRSRVVNLRELCPGLTVEDLRHALAGAFSSEYGLPIGPLDEHLPPEDAVARWHSHFASDDFRLGRRLSFTWRAARRFAWGGVELQLEVSGGVVRTAVCYSDAMREDIFQTIPSLLRGCPFEPQAMLRRLIQPASDGEENAVLADISAMIEEEMQ